MSIENRVESVDNQIDFPSNKVDSKKQHEKTYYVQAGAADKISDPTGAITRTQSDASFEVNTSMVSQTHKNNDVSATLKETGDDLLTRKLNSAHAGDDVMLDLSRTDNLEANFANIKHRALKAREKGIVFELVVKNATVLEQLRKAGIVPNDHLKIHTLQNMDRVMKSHAAEQEPEKTEAAPKTETVEK